MKIKWVRGNHYISFNRPDVWFSLGQRGSGKSSFLEYVGSNYLLNDAAICDLFGSRDGEGLAWLRSPFAEQKKILLIKGDNVDVDSSFDVKCAANLTVKDFNDYDILVSSSPLYTSIDQEFFYAAKITDLLYSRLNNERLIYAICREAANFYYSRLKVSENQTFAKAQMVYLIRESRHVWLALGLDSIRFYAIDIDIRSLSDYLIIKSQGLPGLSQDLKWLYSYAEPHTVRKLKPNQFYILALDGSVGYGIFPEVPWHKKEKENIVATLGIHIERGEALKESEYKGTFHTVSDREHVEIIRLYVEENIGMTAIASKLGRSSRTTVEHIHRHNDEVMKAGFCSSCKRVGALFNNQLAKKGKIAKDYLITTRQLPS